MTEISDKKTFIKMFIEGSEKVAQKYWLLYLYCIGRYLRMYLLIFAKILQAEIFFILYVNTDSDGDLSFR